MRNINLEAAIWNRFTSIDFFEAAACECESAMEWFGYLAVSRKVQNFGRNNQIYDKFKQRARDFRHGAELARLGDYRLIWDVSDSIRGDARGVLEQPLHSWMSTAEYKELNARIDRLMNYATQITRALNNAIVGADSFLDPDPDCPERSNDDDGFPGEEIVHVYNSTMTSNKGLSAWQLPDPLPEYSIDKSITCSTGDEVPWTGVWYPITGLERHSLTFAIKGMKMPPAFRVTKTKEEVRADGVLCPSAETVAVATTWHPVVPSGRQIEPDRELWAKAGQPCPKAGIWQPTDPGAAQRPYEIGEKMLHLGSPYGFTMWRWIGEQ